MGDVQLARAVMYFVVDPRLAACGSPLTAPMFSCTVFRSANGCGIPSLLSFNTLTYGIHMLSRMGNGSNTDNQILLTSYLQP